MGVEGLVIGLYGKWGTGKTSVINMAMQELKEISAKDENPPIVIKFLPWNYSDKNDYQEPDVNQLKKFVNEYIQIKTQFNQLTKLLQEKEKK